MTIDEQIKILESNSEFERKEGDLQGCLNFKQLAEWLKDYKRLKEQEPCDDAISRQAVLDAIEELKKIHFDRGVVLNKVRDKVLELPYVTPQPKGGQWEWNQYDANPKIGNFHCSLCHSIGRSYFDYCPYCGAKMSEIPTGEEVRENE